MTTLQWFVFFAGITHFGILLAGALVPVVLDFRGQLSKVSPLLRHLVWVYAVFIFMCVIGFGLLSVLFAVPLTDGTALARAVCGFIALFWTVRLGIQLFLFDAKPYLTHWFFETGISRLDGGLYLSGGGLQPGGLAAGSCRLGFMIDEG